MSRNRLFGSNPNLSLNSVKPHFPPFIRSIESIALEVLEGKTWFTVKIGGHPHEGLEISWGIASRRTVPASQWKHYLHRYIDEDGSADLRLYEDIGPMRIYLVPVIARFFNHLRYERCRCFNFLWGTRSQGITQDAVNAKPTRI